MTWQTCMLYLLPYLRTHFKKILHDACDSWPVWNENRFITLQMGSIMSLKQECVKYSRDFSSSHSGVHFCVKRNKQVGLLIGLQMNYLQKQVNFNAFLSCISLTLWRLHSNLPCSNYSILIIIYNKQLSLTYFSYQVQVISLCIYTLVLLYTISPFPCTKLSWCLTYCTVLLVLACQLWFVYFLHFALCELMYGCIRHCPLVPTDPSPSFHHGWRNSSVFLLLLLWEKWENITWFSAQARWAASSIYCLWITILTAFGMIFW